MIGLRAALLSALLVASAEARAQPSDASDVAAPLRVAVAAYRAGDLATSEFLLRRLSPGNADAEAWLGIVLLDRGNIPDGLQALQHAADMGSAEGAERLAVIYAEGAAGTARNDSRAVELFEKAAAGGNQRAQVNLGILYFRGQGVTRDLAQARAWLAKAASRDDPYALYAWGRAMEAGDDAVAADLARAADLYRRAAEKGHPLAALRYGLALQDGRGVRRDPAAARKWMEYALTNGVPEAALALGDLQARTPVSSDKAENDKAVQAALAWYQTAAAAGVPSAQFKVGNAYFAGAGVARDPAQAQLWYIRAAQQGLAEAQHALGIMLIGGVAGPADPVGGYKWLLLAERGGQPNAGAVREKASEQMSAKDRARAETLSQNFMPTSERPDDVLPPRLGRPPR